MSIKNVIVKNSRIGVHSSLHEGEKVMQLVTVEISYNDPKQEDKTIPLGLRKRTSLYFCCQQYFGVSYAESESKNKILELVDENGVTKTSIPMPKGRVLGVFNEMFMIKDKDNIYAYDITGAIVAKGKFPNDGSNNITLNRIE